MFRTAASPGVDEATTGGFGWYLLLAFGLAWSEWGVVWAAGITPSNLAQFQLAILPGTFAPAAAAWIVRKWITREGFADLRPRAVPRRWRYFLFALFLPSAVVFVVVGLAILTGLSAPDFTLARALHALGAPDVPNAP